MAYPIIVILVSGVMLTIAILAGMSPL